MLQIAGFQLGCERNLPCPATMWCLRGTLHVTITLAYLATPPAGPLPTDFPRIVDDKDLT